MTDINTFNLQYTTTNTSATPYFTAGNTQITFPQAPEVPAPEPEEVGQFSCAACGNVWRLTRSELIAHPSALNRSETWITDVLRLAVREPWPGLYCDPCRENMEWQTTFLDGQRARNNDIPYDGVQRICTGCAADPCECIKCWHCPSHYSVGLHGKCPGCGLAMEDRPLPEILDSSGIPKVSRTAHRLGVCLICGDVCEGRCSLPKLGLATKENALNDLAVQLEDLEVDEERHVRKHLITKAQSRCIRSPRRTYEEYDRDDSGFADDHEYDLPSLEDI